MVGQGRKKEAVAHVAGAYPSASAGPAKALDNHGATNATMRDGWIVKREARLSDLEVGGAEGASTHPQAQKAWGDTCVRCMCPTSHAIFGLKGLSGNNAALPYPIRPPWVRLKPGCLIG